MPKKLSPTQEQNRLHVLKRRESKQRNRADGSRASLDRLLRESAARHDALPLVIGGMGRWPYS